MALNMTTFAAALKQHYTDEKIENMVYKDNPFLAMISKYEDFGGENLKLPVKYGIPMGRSATFADAVANKSASQLKAFLLTRKADYAIASIANETIEASKGNANAFIEAATFEIDGAIESATRSLAVSLFGDGSGSLGVIGSMSTTTASNDTITLATIQDITNFEVGMQLNFGTASVNKEISSINRDTGVFILDAASGGTVSEAIYVDGDKDNMLTGLGGWLPSTAPTSGDSFFGVDRSADSTRLAGIRFDASSLPLEEGLIGAAARVAREGGKPDVCFINYSNFADLEKALGSKVSYVDVKVNPEIGFRGILIHGPRGPIKVVPDQNCPNGVAYMIQMDVWKLYSLGKAPKILDSDGLKFLRESTADAVEARIGYYAQLGCRAPGFNVRVGL
tara:strand:+ start:2086 stop:3264 length:1179 start_codon:yes stop_codon:yes gene_type:complete